MYHPPCLKLLSAGFRKSRELCEERLDVVGTGIVFVNHFLKLLQIIHARSVCRDHLPELIAYRVLQLFGLDVFAAFGKFRSERVEMLVGIAAFEYLQSHILRETDPSHQLLLTNRRPDFTLIALCQGIQRHRALPRRVWQCHVCSYLHFPNSIIGHTICVKDITGAAHVVRGTT